MSIESDALHYSLTITIIWGPYRVSAEVEALQFQCHYGHTSSKILLYLISNLNFSKHSSKIAEVWTTVL